ncbi:MAG: hypothetical protein AAF773_09275 [Cyanobacteria bacterium P01_D01_bin.115]
MVGYPAEESWVPADQRATGDGSRPRQMGATLPSIAGAVSRRPQSPRLKGGSEPLIFVRVGGCQILAMGRKKLPRRGAIAIVKHTALAIADDR